MYSFMEEKKDLAKILEEDIDEEVLSQLPEWFRILRTEYKKRVLQSLAD